MPDAVHSSVLTCSDSEAQGLVGLLARYGMVLSRVASQSAIPGSHWGAPEAGLIGNRLFARADTPIHSALHEASHYVCMDQHRRAALNTDAGGDVAEENGVCYLQVLLAGELPRVGRARMLLDMDAWGYSFRLGSSRAWFERDAEDARDWLMQRGLIDARDRPTWKLRSTAGQTLQPGSP